MTVPKQAALKEKLLEMTRVERALRAEGARFIAGVDEVGRGPLAGPVVAAAVVLPEDFAALGVDDSKKLSEKKREELYALIMEAAIAVGLGA
ncbi:MAG: ribonuclease HII, partial [Clostridiales Family XIII bacterium]|nr:ribonuclease HII [Clostridiales Family XIII bacterium]